MTAGIFGLGLIGGSLAKAYAAAGEQVLACDTDRSVLDFALLCEEVHGELTRDNIASCDIVIIAVCPAAAEAILKEFAPFFGKGQPVVDCCGTKKAVCSLGFELAEDCGFIFVGGHPMAGNHNSGYKYARANLFSGAPMVLVPPNFDDIDLLDRIKALLAPARFGKFSVTTAQNHDEMIAFTSQMPHLLSNAFIKSPTAGAHRGFSAGSYRDLTRVAWLNPAMWAELFLENRDFLLAETDTFINNILLYRNAIADGDREELVRLLDEGRRRKEEVDGR